jgi:hypothetical protein
MHVAHTMIPQYCYQFYAILVLGAVFGGASASCLAFITLYGAGGVELVLGISFLSVFGFLVRVVTSTTGAYPSSSSSSSPGQYDPSSPSSAAYFTSSATSTSTSTTSSSAFFCGKKRHYRTVLAVDTFLLPPNEEMVTPCSCCPICLSTFETGEEVSIATICHHAYHSQCLNQWLSRSTTCPYCRQDVMVQVRRCCDDDDDVMNPSDDTSKPGMWGLFGGIFDSIYS